ncbi:hypothetical protein CC86DRAFT_312197 [Ophiobolus disseminans]|uniref:Nephrocystin 3-like N-terminal domain-containing protein n=1 Tax=Ophiobolus disseminans TaxID=1469910 RepID=A0A6A7AM16_9PLEO|nr:hypothetical protein CC86DRAFT_312197 [Ophiobolus disseminans]
MSPQTQNDDVGMGEASPDHHLFDEAIEAIQQTLSQEHQRAFRSVNASSLLDELRSIAARTNIGDHAVATSSRKIALFVQTFAPYFNVLSICIQVKTEWSDCFWGLVALLYQVASEYPLFLQKIADLFEAMASVLPPYHQIYAVCKRRMGSIETNAEDMRLASLMSYAYLDICKLLLDTYLIFVRDTRGTELRHLTFVSPLASQWRPMDSRFARLEARLTHHRRWLEKETESEVQDFSNIEHHRKRYVRFLRRQADANGNSAELEEERLAKRMRRIEIVRGWLSNSLVSKQTYRDINSDDIGSCNWFLDMTKYRKWKSRAFERSRANDLQALQSDWHDRILFVQADSGFGKTILARAVADDLATEAEQLENSDDPPYTAFFQVNSNQSDSTAADDIVRELSRQLLHAHRHNQVTLDAACLLLRKTSFSETATIDEARDVLSVLLRQHPTFLIIDGLEECRNSVEFLSVLAGLCRKADSRAIIFSKPAIRIPLEYQKWASDAPHILLLDARHNASAIENVMGRNLGQMADQGYFGISLDRTLISHIAQLSNGSFLWANVLLEYLHSPALSPDERQIILQNAHSLQGLEALYNSVIKIFGRRPSHEKRIVADLFRWLSYPIHRLCTSALRTALTSSIDFAQNEDSYPTDILQVLPQLTCGLVEVSDDNVHFAHPSVREYLQSPSSIGSEFSLWDENSVHAHLTTRCLSYLAHDVPRRPLGGLSPRIRPMVPVASASSSASYRTSKSGDSGYKSLSSTEGDNALPRPAIQHQHTNASTASIRSVPFDTNLPFLRYASLCWPIHLSRALSLAHDHHPYIIPSPGPFSAVPYLPTLSAFLSSRLAVTAWVEASFRYNLPPTLTRLVGPLSDLKAELPPATIEGKELRHVLGELNVLSERLMELKREHATSLRGNPSLIWQMDEADGGEYWPVWDGSTGMPR